MKTKKELTERIAQLEQQLSLNKGFNKHAFVSGLEEEIKSEIEQGNIESEDGISDYINNQIDSACIYYKNCFEIAMELNATDFTEYKDFGDINGIEQLAYAALYEYVYDEINISELEEIIQEQLTK